MKAAILNLKVKKSTANSIQFYIGRLLIAFVTIFGIYSIFLISEKQNPIEVYTALVKCFIGNPYNVGEIGVFMTPVLIAGMAAIIPATVGIFNAGGEGQLIAGALMANIVGVNLISNMGTLPGIIFILVSSTIAGALWGLIPLLGKMYLNMNETLSTLIMNYVMYKLVFFLINGPLKDPQGSNYPQSVALPEKFRFPKIAGTRADYAILFAVILAIVVWFIIYRTELGFKMRAIGGNVRAAEFSGLKVKATQIWSFMTAAGLAGLAGGLVACGTEWQIRETTCQNLGFQGFLATGIVANNPILSILSSFMLAVINASKNTLQMRTGLRSSAMTIFMALILLVIFCLGRRKRDE